MCDFVAQRDCLNILLQSACQKDLCLLVNDPPLDNYTFKEYAACYGEALLYVPSSLRPSLKDLNGDIYAHEYEIAGRKFFELCEDLSLVYQGRNS